MAAQTTTSALAPEVEHSHASINEPSMEDILASIRRIIAEDQSNSHGRSGLGGLTRRQQSTASTPVASEGGTTESADIPAAAHVVEEIDAHAGPQADDLHHAYAAPVEVAHEQTPLPSASSADHVSYAADPYLNEAVYAPHVEDVPEPQHQSSLLAAEQDMEPLMSPVAGASITSSFQTLAESVVLQDPGLIERVMRESMRPLLKAWLDDHLPSIVERLVRTEIERVARGGRARNA